MIIIASAFIEFERRGHEGNVDFVIDLHYEHSNELLIIYRVSEIIHLPLFFKNIFSKYF